VSDMRRRELITLLGGAAAAWPLAARAQERVRHIGMITGISDEAAMRERLAVFLPALQRLGWIEGRCALGLTVPNSMQLLADELIELASR
jgi:hypothetical protein